MTREEAIQWLKVINTKEFGWDEFAMQESQREIRERCEQGVREAIDMAIEALKGGDAEVRDDRTYINEPYMQQSRHDDGKIEVVRCKDCKYFDYSGSCDINTGYCNEHGIDFKSEDFCSYGERAEKWK